MPRFLITKKITAYLTVNCNDEEQAQAWGGKIVATLEEPDGSQVSDDIVEDFEAECNPRETMIELLADDM